MEKRQTLEYKYSSLLLMMAGLVLGFVLFFLDRWLDVNNYPFRFTWSIVILICITYGGVVGKFVQNKLNEQRKREEIVKEEHDRLYKMINGLPGHVIIQESNYTIRYANLNFIKQFGNFEGRFCYEIVNGKQSPCENCLTEKVFSNDLPLKNEEVVNDRIYEVDRQIYKDVDGSKLVIITLNDITERKKAEQELSRLDRLKIVGEIAAGIAHEIRNPLTSVSGFLQLLASKKDTNQYKNYFDLMIQELGRANNIISEFLTIAKDKPLDFKSINLEGIIQSAYPLLAADAMNQDKEIKLELQPVATIFGNSAEIQQLIFNLTRNGLEAMDRGGNLTIGTRMEEEDSVLWVKDKGKGIEKVILDKIGTPFLTTKENGTGLGLTICHGIATRHNASIHFDSNSNGTTVTVKFKADAK